MSILIDKHTRVLVQGIAGRIGSFHSRCCLDYGTNIVAGIRPGGTGTLFEGRIPIYGTVREAVREQAVTATMIFVPPVAAADAIFESIDAEIPLIVCITEGIPVHDMLVVRERLDRSRSILIGPNCSGIISPGKCKMGIMPDYIHRPGAVGIVSRSGTLSYEAVWQLSQRGIGQSTCIGIGGDPIHGMGHLEALRLLNEDAHTSGIILIGEIGGDEEEAAAEYIARHVKKPVAAYVAGMMAPRGRRMGHAGAIISGSRGTAQSKVEALKRAGVAVATSPEYIADTFLDCAAEVAEIFS